MRIIQSSLFRAIVAIAVGVLLVKYREDTMKWLTIVIGLLFFLSGAITLIVYYYERQRLQRYTNDITEDDFSHDSYPSDDGIEDAVIVEDDSDDNTATQASTEKQQDISAQTAAKRKPMFPFAGLGSTILGVILAVMPVDFIIGVTYVLAALLIIGAIQQIVSLLLARRFASIPLLFWFFPVVTLVVGILVVAHPMDTATLPLKVIGWAMMFYGVVECINTVKIHLARKKYIEAQKAKIVKGQLLEE